jgi:hypothetical protein
MQDTNEISRPSRVDNQSTLFDIEPDWKDYWWGMPNYTCKDSRPERRIVMNFMCEEDVQDFANKLGIKITEKTNSLFHPKQNWETGAFEWDGPKCSTRYPICIPSKGRADCHTTGHRLNEMGADYKFFVEETEAEEYAKHVGEDKIVIMPFNNLGQGSIPARNFIWQWAIDNNHERHWIMDDNITMFNRNQSNRKLTCRSGAILRAMEDFTDRYENIAFAGPHCRGFVPDRDPGMTPVLWNSRIYSCTLIKTDLPYRWRGRYNEDTDICLRALKDGWCTALFRSLLMDKFSTAGAKDSKAMKGGNTDNVYNTGDYRRAFAESIKEQHPDCVKISWKFNRWHHHVDYSKFKANKPILKAEITPTGSDDEYGIKLIRTRGK